MIDSDGLSHGRDGGARTRFCRRRLLSATVGSGLAAGCTDGRQLATDGRPTARETTDASTYNVRAYGATGDGETDDSAAFQAAVDDLADAGRGVLYVPAGTYRIESLIQKSVRKWQVTILGDGQGVSNVHCRNSDGLFSFRIADRSSETTLRELTLFANRPGAGTAFEIEHVPGGNRHHRNFLCQNVSVRGLDVTRDYFDRGIVAYGLYRPFFVNTVVAGPYGPGVKSWDLGSRLFDQTVGISVDESYAPVFTHCHVWSADTGFQFRTNEAPGPEGGRFYLCKSVGVRVGIDVYSEGGEPGFTVETCHVNARDVGVNLDQKRFASITNSLLYNSAREPFEYSDVRLRGCSKVIIADNIFHQPNENRIGVDVRDRSTGIVVTDNCFHGQGMTAVATTPGTGQVMATDNWYAAIVDTPIDHAGDDLSFAPAEFRGAGLTRSDTQRVSSGSWKPVEWQRRSYDTAGCNRPEPAFWREAKPGRVTIPSNVGIRYVRLAASISWTNAADGERAVTFAKNGSRSFFGNSQTSDGPGGSAASGPSPASCRRQEIASATVPVRSGDVFQVQARQTSGDPLDVGPGSWFSVQVVDG